MATEKIPHPEAFLEVLESATFGWPGWDLLPSHDTDSGAPLLLIVSETPDSYNSQVPIRVGHPFLVPLAVYNHRVWQAWIMERLVDVFRHETGEFLKFDGVRMFGPHHANGEDPYRTWYVGDYADTRVKAGHDKPEG